MTKKANSAHYVVHAQRSTAVTHAQCMRLSTSPSLHVVVARSTRLSLYIPSLDGLQLCADLPVYGRIAAMIPIPAHLTNHHESVDELQHILILTAKLQICVVAWQNSRLVSLMSGDMSDEIGRRAERGPLVALDAESGIIAMSIYDGLLKILPLPGPIHSRDFHHKVSQAFNVRLNELRVISIAFCGALRLVVLFEDNKEECYFRCYTIDKENQVLAPMAETDKERVDCTAHSMVSIQDNRVASGIIIFSEHTISYHEPHKKSSKVQVMLPHAPYLITSVSLIDRPMNKRQDLGQCIRYLIGSSIGELFILLLQLEQTQVVALELKLLGIASPPSALVYIDNGIIFVGSATADSQLMRLKPPSKSHLIHIDSSKTSLLHLIDSYPNLGPIVDMCTMDLNCHGQPQLITCSGVGRFGSLRIVRNGLGIKEHMFMPLKGLQSLFSIGIPHTFLLLAFYSQTRILRISTVESQSTPIMTEVTWPALISEGETTLYIGSVGEQAIVQVTSARIIIFSSMDFTCIISQHVFDATISHIATACDNIFVVVYGVDNLAIATVCESNIVISKCCSLSYEVSAIAISHKHHLIAITSWLDNTLRMLHTHTLTEIAQFKIEKDVISRSLLFVCLGDTEYIMAGLGDGTLVTISMSLNEDKVYFHRARYICLGFQPVALTPFAFGKRPAVFCSCDQPNVVIAGATKGILTFINVHTSNVSSVTPFACESFPNAMAFVSDAAVSIATLDRKQKLHLRCIALNEQPRRIVYHHSTNTLIVLTLCTHEDNVHHRDGRNKHTHTINDNNGDNNDKHIQSSNNSKYKNTVLSRHFVKLFDAQTFQQLDMFELDDYEENCSIITIGKSSVKSPHFVAVGTAFVIPTDEEPSRGRILLFRILHRKLVLENEREVQGAVFSLCELNGRLLASVNATIHLMNIVVSNSLSVGWQDEQNHELSLVCSHYGHLLALYLKSMGNVFVVGDLMKSMTLLRFNESTSSIEEVGREREPNWMAALEILGEADCIGANNSFNLFTVQHNIKELCVDEKQQLSVVGRFHLSEFVNVFRHGSLVMKSNENVPTDIDGIDWNISPQLVFGTSDGSIGVTARLTEAQYLILDKLQIAMHTVVSGVGGLNYDKWRSFTNTESIGDTFAATNFIDGDLIECILLLDKSLVKQLATAINISVKHLSYIVDCLRRLH